VSQGAPYAIGLANSFNFYKWKFCLDYYRNPSISSLVGLSRISTAINHQKGVEDEAGIAYMIESKKHPQAVDDTRADLAERAADQREEKRKKEEAKRLEILRTSDYLTDRERI